MKNEQGKFKKSMTQMDVWGLALGAIIGWGCFVLPGNAFLPKAGPLGATVGLLIGAVAVIIVSLSYGYLIKKYPVSGGEYIYAKSVFGKGHAFICGWGLILAYWSLIPLNATALALISRYLFPGVIQFGKLYEVQGWDVYAGEVIIASVFIIIMGVINLRGIKGAAWIQTAIALTLVGGILLIAGLVLMQGPEWSNLSPGFPDENRWWRGVFSIVAMAPWAYIGFDCIPQSAEEYNFDHKRSLRIMVLAIIFAAICYIFVNAITALYMPWEQLINDVQPFWATGYAVEMMIGKAGLLLLGIAMFCAVIAGMNAFYISTSRLMYAMAKEKALPKLFGKLGVVHGTPRNAIIFIMIISLFAPWFGREVLVWIVDMTSVGASLVFAYTTAAAAVLARRNGEKVQFYLGILGCLISFFFLSLLVVPGMPGFLATPSWVCLGVWTVMGIVFFAVINKKYKQEKD